MQLITGLEPRYFKPHTLLYEQLDEVNEFYFVRKGFFDVGYEINNKKVYKMRFGPKNVIGAFNVMFNMRSQETIRSSSAIEAFGYRRSNWKKLMNNFPEFEH